MSWKDRDCGCGGIFNRKNHHKSCKNYCHNSGH